MKYEELKSELIAFADEVRELKHVFSDGWNYYNEKGEEELCADTFSVYEDYDLYAFAIEFKGVKVSLYSQELHLPFNLSLIQIAAHLQEAKRVFNIIKQKHGKS